MFSGGGRSPLIIKNIDLCLQPPTNTRSPTLNSEEADSLWDRTCPTKHGTLERVKQANTGRPTLGPRTEPSTTWSVRVSRSLDEAVRNMARLRGVELSKFVRDAVEEKMTEIENLSRMEGQGEMKGRYKTVSLFSGAGGLDVGLASTGFFNLLAAVEIEPQFCATLRANRQSGLFGSRNTKIIQADLSLYTPEQLMDELGIKPGELDLLVGGPPCQAWSTAGKRRAAEDPRGQLIWHYLRFVEALKPKVFLVENVRGLFSASLVHRPIKDRPNHGGKPLRDEELPGSAFKAWVNDALSIGDALYRIDSYELNAVNYGAPQLRERVLIFGNRLQAVTPEPTPTHGGQGSGLLPYRTLREALADLDDKEQVLLDFSPRKKRYLSYVPTGGNWRSMPEEVARESMGRAFYAKGGRSGWWRRLSWDLPSPTITTMPNHSSTSLCHPEETRVLSVAECARIQEFPDGWQFCGSVAEQMKQVGNAVPTRLGKISGEIIAAILEGRCDRADSGFPRYTNTYLKSHVRTRAWWKDGKAVVLNNQD